MKLTVPHNDSIRVISDKLSDSPMNLVLQSNEYVNQVNIILTREQTEDLMRKLMSNLPHSEQLAYELMQLSKSKRT